MSNCAWDNSKTAEYTETADRMLRKFNPYHKDNRVTTGEYRPTVRGWESFPEEYSFKEDDECLEQGTDWMFDKYQYQQWLQEQGNED